MTCRIECFFSFAVDPREKKRDRSVGFVVWANPEISEQHIFSCPYFQKYNRHYPLMRLESDNQQDAATSMAARVGVIL